MRLLVGEECWCHSTFLGGGMKKAMKRAPVEAGCFFL